MCNKVVDMFKTAAYKKSMSLRRFGNTTLTTLQAREVLGYLKTLKETK